MPMLKKNGHFVSPTKGNMSISEVISDISDFVNQEPGGFYRLVIGTDSQAHASNGKPEIDYVTALVVHRLGGGARYYWRKEKVEKKPVLREKIYTETTISLATAEEVVPDLRKAVSPAKYDLEIHIDVGPIGPTREMIKEVGAWETETAMVPRPKRRAGGP